MKKFLNTRVPLILVIILCAVIQVIFWPIVTSDIVGDIALLKSGVWVGYAFLNVAFIVVGAITFLKIKSKSVIQALVPFFIACCLYLAASVLLNIIVMVFNLDYLIPLVINLVFTLLFGAALLIIYKSFSRVAENTAAREERMATARITQAEVIGLKNLTSDAEILAEIKKLIDDFTYSSTRSTPETLRYDEDFKKDVAAVESLLKMNAEKDAIIKAINVARNTLKLRNQVLLASKKS